MNRQYKIEGDISIISRTCGIGYVIEGFVNKQERKVFYRTNGLAFLFGLDLEINLSLDQMEAKRIIDCVVDSVHLGNIGVEKKIELHHSMVTNDLTNAPILVLKVDARYPKFEGEECFRLIFSDEKFILPTDVNCNPIYKGQLD